MQRGNLVIANTGILYLKMIITILVTLLSTRWILQALGAESYGLYMLIGGVASLFSFLNSALSSATQRFLSFEIGKGNIVTISEVFYNSFIIHLACAFLVVVLFIVGGWLLIDDVLNIEEHQVSDARFVLLTMSISTFWVILSVPYQAVMNAHENMVVISLIDVLQSFLKLFLAWYLLSYEGNSLRVYSFLIMAISILALIISLIYCSHRYREVRFSWHKITDFSYIKQLGCYLSWLIFGFICSLGRIQGLPLILNIFWGTVVNAAYGIANQVNSQLCFFSNSMLKAIRPQIVQSEGQGNRERMIRLSFTACKFAVILLSCLVIPFFFNVSYIMQLWLNNVPNYTVDFVKIFLCISLINQLNSGAFLANEGIGKIKRFQLITGCCDILILPLGYIAIKITLNPCAIMYVSLFVVFINHLLGIIITKNNLHFKYTSFLKSVIIPLCVTIVPSAIVLYVENYLFQDGIVKIIIHTCTYLLMESILLYIFGMTSEEKIVFKQLMVRIK